MADIIEFVKVNPPAAPSEAPPPLPAPRTYSVDIAQYPDNLVFTVHGIKVSPASLRTIADELEKIAQIIRTDVVVGIV